MSSRVAACMCLFLAAAAAGAQDWGAFARQSDASQDPFLIDLLGSSDLEGALSICEGIGVRADPAAGGFIEAIVTGGNDEVRTETLLRTLLAGLLDPSRSDVPLADRVAANADALAMLLRSVSRWQDPQLVGALVRVLPVLQGAERLPALQEVGDRLVTSEVHGHGLLLPQETSLAMDWLGAVRAVGSRDFLYSCVQMARLSVDANLVAAARDAAKALSAR